MQVRNMTLNATGAAELAVLRPLPTPSPGAIFLALHPAHRSVSRPMSRSRLTSRSSVSPSPRCLQCGKRKQAGGTGRAVSGRRLAPRAAAEHGVTPPDRTQLLCAVMCGENLHWAPRKANNLQPDGQALSPAAWPAARRHRLCCRAFQPAAALLLPWALLPPIAASWLRAAGLGGCAARHAHGPAAGSAGWRDAGCHAACRFGGSTAMRDLRVKQATLHPPTTPIIPLTQAPQRVLEAETALACRSESHKRRSNRARGLGPLAQDGSPRAAAAGAAQPCVPAIQLCLVVTTPTTMFAAS